jgi:putative transposase
MKFSFIQQNCTAWPVRVMCAVPGISVSGYYAWRSRAESKRATANRHLPGRIQGIHADSSGTYGRRASMLSCAAPASLWAATALRS